MEINKYIKTAIVTNTDIEDNSNVVVIDLTGED